MISCTLSGELSATFSEFTAEEDQRGRQLGVDCLLVLQHLLRHPELDTAAAARICQRSETEARELLSVMERDFGYLERGGTGFAVGMKARAKNALFGGALLGELRGERPASDPVLVPPELRRPYVTP